MLFLNQIPVLDKVTEQAVEAVFQRAGQRGWEAIVLCVIIACVCLLAGYLIKWVLKDSSDREARMSARINSLENYIETVLAARLEDCTKALVESTNAINSLVGVVDRLGRALSDRPCFWTEERQALFIQQRGG